jgi:predicted HAD superfamily Cof-like phosphohydrolase
MSKIRDQVKAFHDKFGIPTPEKPTLPEDKQLRLRLAMLFEEYQELTEALGMKSMVLDEHMAEIWAWQPEPDKIDDIEVMDALGDIDYLSEGFRLTYGVNGDSIANEIQRSNMDKTGGLTDANGKIRKPTNWVGPDIRGCLIAQGWIDRNQEVKGK